jgi:hypothetical protein
VNEMFRCTHPDGEFCLNYFDGGFCKLFSSTITSDGQFVYCSRFKLNRSKVR